MPTHRLTAPYLPIGTRPQVRAIGQSFWVTGFLTVRDKKPNQAVAWARSRNEASESGLDLLGGHPGRIEPMCVGLDAPYGEGDVVVRWYLRSGTDFPVFDVEDRDLEVISEEEYAVRVARMDRGEPPVSEDAQLPIGRSPRRPRRAR